MRFFSLARQPFQSLPILTRSVIPSLSKKSFATFMTPLRGLKSRSLLRSLSCSTLKLIPFWVTDTLSASSVVKKPLLFYSVLLRFDSNFLVNNRTAFSFCAKTVESSCETIHMKLSSGFRFILIQIELFLMRKISFAFRLVLKQRHKVKMARIFWYRGKTYLN